MVERGCIMKNYFYTICSWDFQQWRGGSNRLFCAQYMSASFHTFFTLHLWSKIPSLCLLTAFMWHWILGSFLLAPRPHIRHPHLDMFKHNASIWVIAYQVKTATRAVFTASSPKLSSSTCEYCMTPDQLRTTAGYSPWLGLWEEGNVCGTGCLGRDDFGEVYDQDGLFFVLQCDLKWGFVLSYDIVSRFWQFLGSVCLGKLWVVFCGRNLIPWLACHCYTKLNSCTMGWI